ncbi:MAG: isoprenylcysteine carboxyl methyltransferase family protein [Myxococcales bacterium]
MVSAPVYLASIAALAIQRLFELRRARSNLRWVLAHGGHEVGGAHYPPMVALHAGFLVSCAVEGVAWPRAIPAAWSWLALAGVAAAQGLRHWAMATLGPRWTTRVAVAPSLPPVTGGPYRFVRHPNYLAVGLELALLPLVRGAWVTALVFSLANALLLAIRIRVEERNLGPEWGRAFAHTPRFLPGARRG